MRRFRNTLVLSTIPILGLLISIVAAPSEAVDEPGISSSEIKLGASYPISSPASPFFSDFYIGANAYFDYLNEKGGIYGRKLTVTYKDDQNLPTQAVAKNNELVLKDNVFALFNSAPSTPSHVAVVNAVGIVRRGIPDLALTSSYSLFSDRTKYPTTFVIAPNGKQEARVLLSYIKTSFSSTPINLVYENDELGVDWMPIWQTSGVMVGRAAPFILGTMPSDVGFRTDTSGVIHFSSAAGIRMGTSGREISVSSNNFPFFLRGAALSGNRLAPSLNNTYANFYLPAVTDTLDPYISFYSGLISKYASGTTISQSMIEGADAAYVVSQALAAVGPEPTRKKIIDFLNTSSSTLSSASFSLLNYGLGNDGGGKTQYIAKFDGYSWNRVSDLFLVDVKGNVINSVKDTRLALLPNGLPVMKNVASTPKPLTITCVKGKLSKKVTGINPKCPTGYVKK